MKRKATILLMLIGLTSMSASAQGWKDKIGLGGGDANSGEPETRSMTEIAKLWEDQKLTRYMPYGGGNGMLQASGSAFVKFVKDANGEVIKFRSGTYDTETSLNDYEPYSYGGSDFVDCYFQNHMNVIYMTESSIVSYSLDGDYRVKVINFVLGKKGKTKGWLEEIQAYRDYRDNKLESDRDAIAQEEIDNRAKYTLEGKQVTNIEFVFPNGKPEKVIVGEEYKFGFEITLADGSKMKTKNIGGEAYIEDFLAEESHGFVSGPGEDYMTGMYGAHSSPIGYFKVYTGSNNSDLYQLKISSKFGGDATTTLEIPIAYNLKETYSCVGEDGYPGFGTTGAGGGRAGHGCPLTVEVKLVKHTETGEDLYSCKITDGFTGAVSYVKVRKGGSLHVEAFGGYGGNGGNGVDKRTGEYGEPGKGGKGGKGGNGGNILLIVDPSATGLEFTYDNGGGSGGSGGEHGWCISCPYGSHGQVGDSGEGGPSGTYNKEVKKVSF